MIARRVRATRGARRLGARRRGRPRDAFEIEVQSCARELALMRPLLLADFSAAALAAALAIHAVRSLAHCVREGTMTPEQARALIQRMVDLKLRS